jgi:hypothetical protein
MSAAGWTGPASHGWLISTKKGSSRARPPPTAPELAIHARLYRDGILSHVNGAAARLGGWAGMPLKEFVDLLIAASKRQRSEARIR